MPRILAAYVSQIGGTAGKLLQAKLPSLMYLAS